MIDAVIFDCDGVLVDSEILAHEVEIAALAEFGLDYDRAEFRERFMGMSNKAFFAALDGDAQARLGRSIIDELVPRVMERYRAVLRGRLAEVPGARSCIETVAHPKAVASSSTIEGLDFKLRKTGLLEHFAPHVYSAEHVTHSKPAPDLFLHAAAALAMKPARCLVIEDSVNGVKAGLAAGMTVWGFAGGGHMDDQAGRGLLTAGAVRLVNSWQEMRELLAEL